MTIVASGLAVAPPVSAQEINIEDALRDAFQEQAATGSITSGFQALTIFSGAPGISAASYTVDDSGFEINTFKLAPSYALEIGLSPVKLYGELSLGYLDADQDFQFFDGTEFRTGLDLDIQVFTALAGLGAEIEIAPGTVIRPIGLLGYSRITDDAELNGPFADQIGAAGDGILFDVEIDSLLYGAALELETDQNFGSDINLSGRLRYDFVVDDVVSASDVTLDGTNEFGVFTAGLELDGPVGVNLFGRELRWIGFTSHTFLPGEEEDLGFSFFFELGGGIEIVDRSVVSFIEGASLRASGIVGNGVTGFTIGATLEF